MPPEGVCMSPIVDLAFGGESVTTNRDSDWLTAGRSPRSHPVSRRQGTRRSACLAGSCKPVRSPPSLYPDRNCEVMYADIPAFAKKAKWAGVQARFDIWKVCFTSGKYLVNRYLKPAQRSPMWVYSFRKHLAGKDGLQQALGVPDTTVNFRVLLSVLLDSGLLLDRRAIWKPGRSVLFFSKYHCPSVYVWPVEIPF